MEDSGDLAAQSMKGLKLSHSNYIEWRDIIDDYIDSQGWGQFVKAKLPEGASNEQKAKSSKIAVVLKAAAGSQ